MAGNPNQIIVQTCAICAAQFQIYASVREAVCPTCGATNQVGVRVAPQRPQPMRAAARPLSQPAVRPRVVLQTSGAQKAQSWLVLVMVLVMAGLGGAIYKFRDRIWEKAEKPLAAGGPVAAPEDIDRPYRNARMRLLDGDRDGAREAAKSFRELDGPGVPQPLRNWVTFHSGLAHLIAGESQPAKDRFARLTERAAFSKDPANARLVTFFLQSAELGSMDKAIPPDSLQSLDRNSYQAMGLLVAGLKNWQLGASAEASALFDEFARAEPAGEDEWVAEYKDLAKGFVGDFKEWTTATETFNAAKDAPDKQAAAVNSLKAARTRLMTKQFSSDLLKMETTLAEAIAAREAALEKMLAAREVSDVALIADLKVKTDALAKQLQFTEALKLVIGAKVESPRRKPDLEALQKRIGWLARFKRNLILDLAATGYKGGVTKRDGKTNAGDVRKADEQQVETVPWTEVSVDWLVKVATAHIDALSRLDFKSDRQFDLGVFLLSQGRTAEAEAWMVKAGDIKWEYKEGAILLLDAPAAK